MARRNDLAVCTQFDRGDIFSRHGCSSRRQLGAIRQLVESLQLTQGRSNSISNLQAKPWLFKIRCPKHVKSYKAEIVRSKLAMFKSQILTATIVSLKRMITEALRKIKVISKHAAYEKDTIILQRG